MVLKVADESRETRGCCRALTHRTSGSLIYFHKNSRGPEHCRPNARPRRGPVWQILWRTAVPPPSPDPCRAACTRLADSDTLVSRPRDGPRRAPPPPSRRYLRIRLEIHKAPPCTVRLAQKPPYPTMQHNPSPLAPLVRRSPSRCPGLCVCESDTARGGRPSARGGRPSSLPRELEGARHDARHSPVSLEGARHERSSRARPRRPRRANARAISCSARAHPRLPQARQSAPTPPRGSHATASPGCRHPRRRGCRR